MSGPIANGSAPLEGASGASTHAVLPLAGEFITRVDLEQAARFLSLLGGGDELQWRFRTLPEGGGGKPQSYVGSLDDVASDLLLDNGNGYGVFVVVNEGDTTSQSITRVRALFADFDIPGALEKLLEGDPNALTVGGVGPNAIVESSEGRHHVYWLVSPNDPIALAEFSALQKSIARMYGSDPAVADLPRIMRLPGFFHRKRSIEPAGKRPWLSRVVGRTHDSRFTAAALRTRFPVHSGRHNYPDERVAPPQSLADARLGIAGFLTTPRTVDEGRHDDLRGMTAALARVAVAWEMRPESVVAAVESELSGSRAGPRYTREMPADEVRRAIEGAVAKFEHDPEWRKSLQHAKPLASADHPPAAASPSVDKLASKLEAALRPISDEVWAAAAEPHPHLFGDGESGLFPIGEATVLGAYPRSGKTTLMVHLAVQASLGRTVGGLPSRAGRVVIYSREDDQTQYARKLRSECAQLTDAEACRVRVAVMPPDLRAPGLREASALIDICEKRRRPIETAIVDALIKALRPMVEGEDPVRLVVFETASTLSHADEDNKGLGALAAALKKIAQDLGVAVVLTHHLSQESAKAQRLLDLSTAMVRGGTALVADTRQVLLLVDLGGADEPLPEKDHRSIWRHYLTQAPFDPLARARMTALVTLDTSKARDPVPLVFAWNSTPDGPALMPVSPPSEVDGLRWGRYVARIKAWGALQRSLAKGEQKTTAADGDIASVLKSLDEVVAANLTPTASAIAKRNTRSVEWVESRLKSAAQLRLVTYSLEVVPRGPKQGTWVYRRAEASLAERDGQADSESGDADDA